MKMAAEMKFVSALTIFMAFILYCCIGPTTIGKESSDNQKLCDSFKIVKTAKYATDLDLKIPNETEIGWVKNFNGIRPIHYDWNITFSPNITLTFRSELRILIETVSSVDRLIIDINPGTIEFDKSLMRLVSVADESITCIKSAIMFTEDRRMVAELNQKLINNSRYVLEIGSIQLKSNSKGVVSTAIRVGGLKNKSQGINTLFQMRGARTVIPSFDHPSLKATFRICIGHATDKMAASNTPMETTVVNGSTQIDCFKKTPIMPLYVVTVALMKNITLVSKTLFKNVEFDLYYPNHDRRQSYEYQFTLARQVFEFMENATKFSYPLSKYGMMNVDYIQFWGVENFGLVSMDAGFTKSNASDTSFSIVVHEIIHQWLGNVVTVSDWREICLQEGLTALLEWIISNEIDSTKITPNAKAHIQRYASIKSPFKSALIQEFNFTAQIRDRCFGQPPAVLFMFTYTYGFNVWFKFLAKLIEDFKYSNANLTDWANTLSAVTGDKRAGETLKSWYTEIGAPVTFSSMDDDKVTIEQFILFNDYSVEDENLQLAKRVILTPFRILTNGGYTTSWNKPIFMDQPKKVVTLNEKVEWFAVDPSGETLTQNIYTVDNYLKMVECYTNENYENCILDIEYFHNIITDFCTAFTRNWLPFGKDKENFNATSWTVFTNKIFALANVDSNKILNLSPECECCMNDWRKYKPVDELDKERLNTCWPLWNERCLPLKLNQKIGRNFTLGEKSSGDL